MTAGLMQSPINIVSAKIETAADALSPLQFNYDASLGPVKNTGMNLQIDGHGTALLNGREFELTQFHFHHPAEHTIDGKTFPIEAHFVHVARDGRMAAVAVMLVAGAENSGFAEVLDAFKSPQAQLTLAKKLLPAHLSYYHYLGSLTTPPLTENVEWYILTEPVEISPDQIAAFKNYFPDNHRHLQPLNARPILRFH